MVFRQRQCEPALARINSPHYRATDFYVCSTEPVDRLLRVAHTKQRSGAIVPTVNGNRQQLYQLYLHRIGVLKLVDQYMRVLGLHRAPDRCVVAKQTYRKHHAIMERQPAIRHAFRD